MRIIDSSDRRALNRLLARAPRGDAAVKRRVARIVADVRQHGDAALRRYARQFDGLHAREPLVLDGAAIAAAGTRVKRRTRQVIAAAVENIRRVAEQQLPESRTITVAPGVTIDLRVSALAAVGCYVPAGRNPLVSSVLMTVVPARTAGVPVVMVACPRPGAEILCAARAAGATSVLRAGGAHAIAALAYGTESVAPVHKIVGPGNAYVAAAKALVAADCAIDFHAGPTELVVVSVAGNPQWIAADLLAQAEHDPDARAVFVTPAAPLARQVAALVRSGAARFGAAAASVRRNGAAVVTGSLDEAIAIADALAPEHLSCDDERVAACVRHAGTIFVGGFTAPALGDYITGSNHVLPTAGAARARGGLSAADFVKTITVQHVTAEGLAALRDAGVALARMEGLEGHARSIEVRA